MLRMHLTQTEGKREEKSGETYLTGFVTLEGKEPLCRKRALRQANLDTDKARRCPGILRIAAINRLVVALLCP